VHRRETRRDELVLRSEGERERERRATWDWSKMLGVGNGGEGGTGENGIARMEGRTCEVNVLYKSMGRW